MGLFRVSKDTQAQIDSSEKINKQNIEYQEGLNNMIFKREDNAHQREVADLEAAGLSSFGNLSGAQATGSGVAAPQVDGSMISNAYSNERLAKGQELSAFNDLGDQVSNLLGYIEKKAELSHKKDVDEHDMNLADEKFALENYTKRAETDINRINTTLAQHKDMREADKHAYEIELMIAEHSKKLAEESSIKTNEAIALKGEKRAQALYNIELNKASIEIESKLQQYTHNREMYPILLELEKNKKKLSDKEIETYMDRLKLEKTKVNTQAFRDICLGLGGIFTGVGKVVDSASGFFKPKIGF